MQLYLDTSALTKLVVLERETAALRGFLAAHHGDDLLTAALARTELIRSIVRRGMLDAVPQASRLLGRMHLAPMTSRLLDDAATMPPPGLRTLDAIHLAAARTAPRLRAVVTYDRRLAEAAQSLSLPVAQPA